LALHDGLGLKAKGKLKEAQEGEKIPSAVEWLKIQHLGINRVARKEKGVKPSRLTPCNYLAGG
jgi:hypothetical protein